MPRALTDAELKVTGTLPNAANTANSGVLDLGATTPWPATEKLAIKVAISTATGANNKNINIRLMDSADNVTFANVAVMANPILRSADANGAGHSANSITIQAPMVRRYVQATALGEANGGDSSDGTFTAELLF